MNTLAGFFRVSLIISTVSLFIAGFDSAIPSINRQCTHVRWIQQKQHVADGFASLGVNGSRFDRCSATLVAAS